DRDLLVRRQEGERLRRAAGVGRRHDARGDRGVRAPQDERAAPLVGGLEDLLRVAHREARELAAHVRRTHVLERLAERARVPVESALHGREVGDRDRAVDRLLAAYVAGHGGTSGATLYGTEGLYFSLPSFSFAFFARARAFFSTATNFSKWGFAFSGSPRASQRRPRR